jgi:hypothetical protein
MAAERGPDGRFLKGHTPIPGAHRPKGVVNVITKSLRERILDGFGKDDGVTQFVRELKRDCPGAAAVLLARLLPPSDVEAPQCGPVIINVMPIASGTYVVNNEQVGEAEVRQVAESSALLLEHQPAEHVPAPIEITEPKLQAGEAPIEPDVEHSDGGVFVVQSARLRARRRAG